MNHAGDYPPVGYPLELLTVAGVNGYYHGQTLAIVGSHPATRELAPFDDPSIEIWLFNEAAQKPSVYKRWDGLLQIHAEEVYTSLNNWVNKDHWAWLQKDHGKSVVTGHPKRIFMQAFDERIPNCAVYPLEGILGMLPLDGEGKQQFHYLRSSPAMALALGIYLGYERILLYGSELSSNTEYTYQATNYAFWIGFAAGRGIDIQLRCWQSEFNQRIYGYEGETQIDKEYFIAREQEVEPSWKANESMLEKVKSRMTDAMLEHEYDKVGGMIVDLNNAAQAAGETFAIMSEARRYADKPDMISRQEFERTSAKAQENGDALRTEKDKRFGVCEYLWNAWKQSGSFQALNQLRKFISENTKIAYDCGTQYGIYVENIRFMNEYDKRLTAAGGVRALGNPEEYVIKI
jgi:hypothetical protein